MTTNLGWQWLNLKVWTDSYRETLKSVKIDERLVGAGAGYSIISQDDLMARSRA